MKGWMSVGCSLIMAWVGVATCQAIEDWQDSEMIGQNKEPGHSTLVPFATRAQAESGPAYKRGSFLLENTQINWLSI